MKRTVALAVTSVMLTGCAVPVPLQIASWVADGISLLTTEKSLTDHGISMVVDKDCALFRGLTEGEVCRDDVDGPVAVADAGNTAVKPAALTAGAPDLRPPFPTEPAGLDQLATFETAAGQPSAPVSAQLAPADEKTSLDALMASAATPAAQPTVVKPSPDQRMAAADLQAVLNPPAAAPLRMAPVLAASAKTTRKDKPTAVGSQPMPGLYLVIGSFRDYANARTMLARHPGLSAQVLAAKVSANTVFRVVVGPFVQPEAGVVKTKVRAAGIRDTWSINVKPEDWRLAHRLEAEANVRLAASTKPRSVELAELPR